MTAARDETDEATVTLDDAASSDRRFYMRVGVLVMLAALAWLVWKILAPVWQPLAWAVLLGALLMPVHQRLARRLGGRAWVASTITTLLAVVLLILPLAFVLGAVAAQSAELLAKLDGYFAAEGDPWSLDVWNLPLVGSAFAWLDANTSVNIAALQEMLVAASKRVLGVLMSSGGSVVMGALGTLGSFLLMLVVLFFVLRDGRAAARQIAQMLPIGGPRRTQLGLHLLETTRAVFMGIGLTAVVQGTLVGIGFWIAGLPSPLVFGVVAILAALIPMVGAALVWAPAAILLATHGEYGHAIFLAAWGAIMVGMVDNLLRPMLISGRAEVPTLAVFLGVMGGLAAFGFIGLFVGPIVLGLLIALFRFEREKQAARETG